MKKPVKGLGIGLFVCVIGWFGAVSGQEPSAPEPGYVPGEVLVRYRSDSPRAKRDAIVSDRGGRVLRRLDAVHVDHVELPPGLEVAAARAWQNDPDVLSVEPNYLRQLVSTPNDPYWVNGTLWGLKKIQAEGAWLLTTGSSDVVVANFDTGVNYAHPDLAANMWRNPGEIAANGKDDDANGYVDDVYGIDTANRDSDPMDDHGHGSHTAGTIGGAGNNGTGVVGVNWNVKILPCKFFKADGSGSDAGAIECFNYVVALKKKGVNIRVTSNSWGSARNLSAAFPQALKDAIDAAGSVGILNAFAAGNAGVNIDSKPFDPASFTSPSIVSVAASDSADNRASFSNYGPISVDIAAPGVSITSTTKGTSYATMSGTSMAAPHVAGAAALLAAVTPDLTVAGIKSLLMSSVDQLSPWSGVVASGGRLNVFSAALDGRGDIAPTISLIKPVTAAAFTAPATIAVEAAATDADGTIAKVDFYANGALIGTDSLAPYVINWSSVQAGSYDLTAVATDDRTFTATSATVRISVENPVSTSVAGINVAAAVNGGRVTASSRYSTLSAASYATDGNRRASSSGNSWADGTMNSYPDWLQVDFNGAKAIGQIELFTGQINGSTDPTLSMTSGYALADFQVQYWTGSQWVAVPGGIITSNKNVWRQFVFTPVSTTAIRVLITRSGSSLSRIAEIEAYETSTASAPPVEGNGLNVASAANGSRVSASSRYSTLSAASYATDGNRRASSSGNSWADGTMNSYPDWLQVDFNGAKAIGQIELFTGQIDGSTDPTLSMTSGYALADFQVQYWTGSQWAAVPGGIITSNKNVWRQFVFTPVSTTAIRVLISRSGSSLSRIAEIEAYESSTTSSTTAKYEVGPTKPFATPSAVPWEKLVPGDLVLIHWRSTPYKDKWVISGQGSQSAPIVIRGVPGPDGQLPVIDGNGAVTRLALHYWNENRAVIKIGGSSIPADTMPRHIIIENLDVRGARPPYTFRDHNGAIQSYAANAAAITIEKGENITLRNNRLHDNGNGLFVASSSTNVSRNILIEGNTIFDNGNVGSAYEHNTYTEALGITFQYNHFGLLKAGSVGTNLKDRSAGTVVRYNWIEGGNRILDFVDSANATVRASSLYRVSNAYGNILIKRGEVSNHQVAHYGGDTSTTANYRKGVLFFYNNTVISTRADRTTLFAVSTNGERVDARNNIFYVSAAGTTLSLLNAAGTLDLSHNWFKPGYVSTFGTLTGILNDNGTSVLSASPGFRGEAVGDFSLTSTSLARNAGTSFSSVFSAGHNVTEEYVKHQSKRARRADAAIDLGAFEVE